MAGVSERSAARVVRDAPFDRDTGRESAPWAAIGARRLSADLPQMRVARLVEAEIVPRLVLARRATARTPASLPADPLATTQEVALLARLVLNDDESAAKAQIAMMREAGQPLDQLYLELLAPTARHLGELWTADICDFAQVTLGLLHLQHILRDLGPTFVTEDRPSHQGRRALLSPLPGEQHTFGLWMVADFLRRSGWDVQHGEKASAGDLVRTICTGGFEVVGLSVSSDAKLEGLAAGIRAIRRASRDRKIGVLVGGPVFVDRPDLAQRVGADATASDGRQAALQAENLLALVTRPS